MKLKALEDFTCYPDGDTEAARKDFVAGQEFEVSDSYGKILVGKGHAEEVKASPSQKRGSE